MSSGSAYNTEPLSETILACQDSSVELAWRCKPLTKHDSAFVFSWNSLLGVAANKGFGLRCIFTAIPKGGLASATPSMLCGRCSVGR